MDETTRTDHLTMGRVIAVIRTRFHEAFRIRRGRFAVAPADAGVASMPPAGYKFTELSLLRVARDPLIAARGKTKEFTTRLADGHRCFGFLDASDALAAYFWGTIADRAPIAVRWELGTELLVPIGTAYVWDCYTAEAYRRCGLYTSGLRLLRVMCAERGMQRVAICAALDNAASLAGIASAGFVDTFAFTIVRIGNRACIRTTDGHWSFRRLVTPHAVLAL